jgi:DUF1365 family protein
VDRWNLLSFYQKDHGSRDGTELWGWALDKLKGAGVKEAITEIELQTFPRILGYVFNPVSFWFCYAGTEQVAVIAEVNNTFGESHSYVIPRGGEIQKKVLQVSPFFTISGDYKFSFSRQQDKCVAGINYFRDGQHLLFASVEGSAIEWTPLNLFKTWLCHPLMTFLVMALIHWHAGILFLKRVPFFGKNGIEEVVK